MTSFSVVVKCLSVDFPLDFAFWVKKYITFEVYKQSLASPPPW